jgi:hypothetical protein
LQPKCQAAVQAAAKAAGRAALTKGQLQQIETEIDAKMRQMGRTTPGWQSMTSDQRLAEAGAALMADIQAAAKRKLENAQRQIVKQAQTESRVTELQGSFAGTKMRDGTRAEAFKRDMELTFQVATAERKIAQGGLMSLIEAAGDRTGTGIGKRFLMLAFNAENRAMTADIVREVFKGANGQTGNTVAKAAARAWLDTIEQLRTRFNAAGGDVGKLDYGYTPQPHDTAKIRKAGADAWAQKTLPLLDRTRYLREDGSRMADDEVLAFLKSAHETLATEGLNKQEAGAFKGVGKRANRGADSRQIHFADGEAWLSYMDEFGRGSLFDAMMAHISGITRDVVLVERYGPDANATGRVQMDLAKMENASDVGAFTIEPQTYWDMITGKVGTPKNETMARHFETVRNLQTAAKLGGAIISSVTDLGTLALTAAYNRLPYWQMLKDVAAQGDSATREFMSTHGMIAESVSDAMNRWSGDNIGQNWSGKAANAVMRLSLLNAWTDGLRQGFTLSMNAGLARMAKKGWAEMSDFDRSRLTRAGLNEADWQALQTVVPTNWKGRELLTPQAIKASGHPDANALAAKVFGFIHDESEFAIVNPDMATRAIVTQGGQQTGTWSGEIARTVAQFKSFPIAMMTRHWRRMLEGDQDAQGGPMAANRLAYGTALMVTTLGLGAIATQAKQVLAGKDPIDMEKPRFWAKALAQGGGFGIAGDLFLIDPSNSATDSATTAIKNLAGPTIGTAADLVLKNVTENIWQAADGKDTHWEAELMNWGKSNTPGASLWWLKPMIEHGFTNAVNESISPGYLSRVQQRAAKEWGQQYWWKPGDTLPARAPDLGAAVGQ